MIWKLLVLVVSVALNVTLFIQGPQQSPEPRDLELAVVPTNSNEEATFHQQRIADVLPSDWISLDPGDAAQVSSARNAFFIDGTLKIRKSAAKALGIPRDVEALVEGALKTTLASLQQFEASSADTSNDWHCIIQKLSDDHLQSLRGDLSESLKVMLTPLQASAVEALALSHPLLFGQASENVEIRVQPYRDSLGIEIKTGGVQTSRYFQMLWIGARTGSGMRSITATNRKPVEV